MRILRRKHLDLNAPAEPGEVEYSPLGLTRMTNFIVKRLTMIIVVGSLVLTAIVASTATYAIVSTLQRNDINENQKAAESLALAGLVGNCAFLNITQGFTKDMVTRMQKYGVKFATPEGEAAFYAETLPVFQQVDCKALVPAKDRAEVTLNYPTTLPPNPAK